MDFSISFVLTMALVGCVLAAAGGNPPATAAATELDALPDLHPTLREYLPQRQLHLYFPTAHQPRTEHRPAILFVHGGGWAAGTPELFAPHCRYYAARGLVAVNVQYRLTAQAGVTIFDCIADVKAAIRWIRTHAAELGVDPQRLAIAGDSAGGHLAACAGLIPGLEAAGEDLTVSSRPDALILYNPVIAMTPPDGWDLVRFSGQAGAAVAARAREFSPVDHVAAGAPPTLVIHGTVDPVTPIAWSERFVAAMKQAGNRIEFVRLEGKTHAFVIRGYGDDATVLAALRHTDAFLRALGYLPAAAPPAASP